MIATAEQTAVKPSVADELAAVLKWLANRPDLNPQNVECDDRRTRIVFPRECYPAFVEAFKGERAKLTRGSYGSNWLTITSGRTSYECWTPKLPETEEVVLGEEGAAA
jgi:hypothetical protein